MKKLLLLTIATAFGSFSYAQKIYTNPNFKQLSNQHKLIAILPAEVKVSYKTLPKYFDYEANKDKETELSYKVQSALYTFLLERPTKNNIGYQDLDKTNVLLKRAGMLDSLNKYTKEEIANALEVDAVVSERYEVEHFNINPERTKTAPTDNSSSQTTPFITGSATLTVVLNDKKSGNLLWRFYTNDQDYNVYSSMGMIERITKKTIKNFPYSN